MTCLYLHATVQRYVLNILSSWTDCLHKVTGMYSWIWILKALKIQPLTNLVWTIELMVTEFTNFSYHFQFKILNHIIFLLSKSIITANPQVRQILIVPRQPYTTLIQCLVDSNKNFKINYLTMFLMRYTTNLSLWHKKEFQGLSPVNLQEGSTMDALPSLTSIFR